MGERQGGSSSHDDRYDHVQVVASFLAWLERGGLDAIPRLIPPLDADELKRVRRLAEQVAKDVGRLEELKAHHQLVVDWALDRYRARAEFTGIFAVHYSPAEQRLEGLEVVLDAVTGYELADVLDDRDTTTLMTRFDVWLGGPLFREQETG